MTTVAIIQARMGSSRFPGKMVAPLGDWALVEWVLARSARSQRVDSVVLATTRETRDDVLCDIALRLGMPVFRGDEQNVLGRYSACARAHRASTVVRICGDRPLIDPALVDAAIADFAAGGADLIFNHISEGAQNWPRGFGAEVLSAALLHDMAEKVDDPYHREHVTSFVWHNRDRYNVRPVVCPGPLDSGFPDLRLDVDTPEDLDLLRTLLPSPDLSVTAETVVENWRHWSAVNDQASARVV